MASDHNSTKRIRLVVVDDHRAFSEALATAISFEDDLECVGIASTGEEGLGLVQAQAPDVVLMDVNLPDSDGIDVTRRVKESRPETRVVVLTGYADVTAMARAAGAGAAGFLQKEASISDVLGAIRTAGDGGMLIQASTLPSVLRHIQQQQVEAERPEESRLTERERGVLELMGQGLDPTTIARRLSISVHTCRGHVKNILAKLGAHSQLEAVVIAVRRGLVRVA